jgi:hypothetical protein
MGTRNSTIVISDGEVKVAQYGQWDGYPTGQGKTIAEFLKKADLNKFKEELNKIHEITDEENELVSDLGEKFKKYFPHLSRDTGADILNMIYDGKVRFVSLNKEFKNDTLFCEYWYEINLDDNTVNMNGKKYTFDEWKKEGFMEDLEKSEEENY